MIISFELALTMYLLSTIFGILELKLENKIITTGMLSTAGIGFFFHSLNIVSRYIAFGYLPVISLHEAASVMAWSMAIFFFLLKQRYRIGLLGSFIMPLIFGMTFISAVLPRASRPLSPVLRSNWLTVHTAFGFMGNAAFAMACGVGIMFLIQNRFLKSKRPGELFKRLPSLEMMDTINYKLITIGFPLLTIAIISGSIWSDQAWGSYWHWQPKQVWALCTWGIYALIIHVRLRSGWRGKRAAILSIVGFAAVLITFFCVNIFSVGLHRF